MRTTFPGSFCVFLSATWLSAGEAPISQEPNPPTDPRLKVETSDKRIEVRARRSGGNEWFDLLTYVIEPTSRPYLHPVRDPAGKVVLTDDKPADHPWQHGIFTGFHGKVNGHEYWMENDGQQRFVRLLELKEEPRRVSWRARTELIEPTGRVIAEEEDSITIHAPDSADSYMIDFGFVLRAKNQDLLFEKNGVGGLAVRMPWDKANPRQTHLNSNGQRGRQCEQKRAAWCNVERPFGRETFGFAVFDHPGNSNHPSGWRVDEQGLINPSVTALNGWSIPAGQERAYRYRVLVYRGSATADFLNRQFEAFQSGVKDGP